MRDLDHQILNYLRENPAAADSVNGIARSWLGQGASQYQFGEIEAAANRLVQIGLMRKISNPDGRVLFRLGDG
jgi:hypothetical protein